jgi:hypothetical protein
VPSTELIPGDVAAVDHDHGHVGFAFGVALDSCANDATVADLQPRRALCEVRVLQAAAHLGDEPGEQFQQVVVLLPDDLEATGWGLVFVELDRIDRDAGTEQVGAELEDMVAALGVAHAHRFEIDVLEVDQPSAPSSLEVEAAAAQQARGPETAIDDRAERARHDTAGLAGVGGLVGHAELHSLSNLRGEPQQYLRRAAASTVDGRLASQSGSAAMVRRRCRRIPGEAHAFKPAP